MKPNDDNSSSIPGQLPQPVAPIANPPIDDSAKQTEDYVAEPANTYDPQTSTKHLEAEDLDLIEKEWVLKAKQVVDQTQGDPYEQNKELNKIKADYIKKRYNRAIKLK